jgi:hypothetical protein
MTNTLKTTIIYIPTVEDTSDDRWNIVAASLRAAGVKDIRPAPMPAQSYIPRHARPVQLLLSSVEV